MYNEEKKRPQVSTLKNVLHSKVGLFLKLDHQGFHIPCMENWDLCSLFLNLDGFVITLINRQQRE